jgi:hypothetical protein
MENDFQVCDFRATHTELLTKDDFFTNSFTTLIHYNKNSCLLLGERENSAEMWITLLPKKL